MKAGDGRQSLQRTTKLSTIKCQRESDSRGIGEVHKTTALLPGAEFEEEAHDGAAAIAFQDGRVWRAGYACLKDRRGDELVSDWGLIERWWRRRCPGLDRPDIGLSCCARGNLVGLCENGDQDVDHAAGGAVGDIFKGERADDVVGSTTGSA